MREFLDRGEFPWWRALVAAADAAYSRLLIAMIFAAATLLFAMLLLICSDVLLRNVQVWRLPRGVAVANDFSEISMYLMTLLAAPWLLRQSRHIRVDVLLRVIPSRLAWTFEWFGDGFALICCLTLAWYGLISTLQSRAIGAMNIKVLVFPEWWLLAPLPATFLLLAIEVLFRMRRLSVAPIGPRDDVVSAS